MHTRAGSSKCAQRVQPLCEGAHQAGGAPAFKSAARAPAPWRPQNASASVRRPLPAVPAVCRRCPQAWGTRPGSARTRLARVSREGGHPGGPGWHARPRTRPACPAADAGGGPHGGRAAPAEQRGGARGARGAGTLSISSCVSMARYWFRPRGRCCSYARVAGRVPASPRRNHLRTAVARSLRPARSRVPCALESRGPPRAFVRCALPQKVVKRKNIHTGRNEGVTPPSQLMR